MSIAVAVAAAAIAAATIAAVGGHCEVQAPQWHFILLEQQVQVTLKIDGHPATKPANVHPPVAGWRMSEEGARGER